MNARGFLLSAIAAVVLVAGCAGVPQAGVVGGEGGPSLGFVPKDIPFTAIDGRQTTFEKVRQPIAILGFTASPGAQCCWLSPEMTALSRRLWQYPVTVAQISLPTSPCPHGPGCIEACRLGKAQLMSLCDAERTAWKAYGKPAIGTVILIDENGEIVATAMVTDMDALARKAEVLGEKARVKDIIDQY